MRANLARPCIRCSATITTVAGAYCADCRPVMSQYLAGTRRGDGGYQYDRCELNWQPCADCEVPSIRGRGITLCPRCRLARKVRRQKQRAKTKRLQRSGGDPITVQAVCERDGWICHLCSDPIPEKASEGWANDPTIDHLIPVSKGGLHRWNNVKAAHHHCNSERRDAPLPELLDEWDLFGVVA